MLSNLIKALGKYVGLDKKRSTAPKLPRTLFIAKQSTNLKGSILGFEEAEHSSLEWNQMGFQADMQPHTTHRTKLHENCIEDMEILRMVSRSRGT